MFVCDAATRIQGLWGPYSPKVYDGHWIRDNKRLLKIKFHDDRVIADNHFSWGRDNLHHPRFYATYAKPAHRRAGNKHSALPAKKARYNDAVQAVRARVEAPFGEVKGQWKCLNEPFFEPDPQHEYIVRLAFAIHNFKL